MIKVQIIIYKLLHPKYKILKWLEFIYHVIKYNWYKNAYMLSFDITSKANNK